ncbi:MAG TPA: surface lipoprotein assembly modifier [Burkholderiales bacterium]|nr:surface lipoprotein assembly modifier [Burkholderiales bacterium]
MRRAAERLLRSAFALACVAACAAAQAQSESPPDVRQRIAQASRLLEAGRIDEAQAIVTPLRARAHPDLQVLFLSGALHFIAGRYDEAAAEYRLMLARDPTLPRPRLELARALYLARDYQASRYHFEQALALPLPEPVRRNVLAYIDAIRERLPSFSFSLDVVADSNPTQATSSETVQIGGLLFRLDDKARSQEARGALLTAQARLPLPSDPSLFARGYVEYYDYPGRGIDQLYVQATAGKHFNLGEHGVDVEAGGHDFNYGGRTLYGGVALRVADFVRAGQALGVLIAADSKQLDYDDFPFLSGWQHTASVDLRRALDARSSLSGGLAYALGTAEERAFAFERPAANLRYLREWRGGWISSLSWQYSYYHFRARDPFFGIVREDRENVAELGILNRYLSYRGVSPRITLGYANRDSNLDLYSYERTYVRVGIVTEF